MTEPPPVWKVPIGDLSDRQMRILAFIERYMTEHAWAPTISEIARREITSKSVIHYHLCRLVRLGYIERGTGARTIRVVKTLDNGA